MTEVIHEYGVDINSKWSFKNGDVELIRYDDNLIQSIVNRLNCLIGSLDIFYEYYGSNIYEYLGWIRDTTTLEYIKIEIEDALKQDPRLVDFNVSVLSSSTRNLCDVDLEIKYSNTQSFSMNLVIKGDGTVSLLNDLNTTEQDDEED